MTYQLSRQTKVCIDIRTGLHALVGTKWILNEPLSVSRGTKVGGEEVCSGEEWGGGPGGSGGEGTEGERRGPPRAVWP